MKSSSLYENYKDRATKIIQQTICHYDRDNKNFNSKIKIECLVNQYNIEQSRPRLVYLQELCHRSFIIIDDDPNVYMGRLTSLTLKNYPQKEDRPMIIRLLDKKTYQKETLHYKLYDSINLYYHTQFSVYV